MTLEDRNNLIRAWGKNRHRRYRNGSNELLRISEILRSLAEENGYQVTMLKTKVNHPSLTEGA